ncbi:VOC family protein [Allosphingosinicella sp.]|uniref:VOC family protein n=1 Tax=Allosphingosinicella sp. TaxID=2823234 RepID=UPI002FC10E73
MIHYQPDHIHLLASDVMGVAEWYRDKLGAEIVLSKQSDGQSRVDLKIGDLQIYMSDGEVMKKWLGGELGPARTKAHLGLDHFGLSVDDVDAAIADLELKGVQITFPPTTIRPGCRAAYIAAPDGVEIEIVNRDLSVDFVQ